MLTNHLFKKTFRFAPIFLALEAALAGGISFKLGCMIDNALHVEFVLIGGMWCMVSSLIVLQSLIKETIQQFWTRLLGAVSGVIIGGLLCQFFGSGIPQLIAAIFFSVLIMVAIGNEKAARITSVTAGVVVVFGMFSPDTATWSNALLRFTQSALGSLVAVSIVLLFDKLGVRKVTE